MSGGTESRFTGDVTTLFAVLVIIAALAILGIPFTWVLVHGYTWAVS